MYTKNEAYELIGNLVERFGEQLSSYKKSEYNETLTRRDFIDPMFKALGWDMDNSQGYAEAYREVIHEDRVKVAGAMKAPDYSFKLPGGKRLFFLEAKKPSILVKAEILPAYQLRRYGWSAKMPISLITDFEEFAVYDCTKKPNPTDKASTGRIRYITYKDYINEFDFLWDTFSKERVLKGGFDKFIAADTAKKGTATVDKEFLLSLDEWRTRLAITISKRNPGLDEEELNFAVQQLIDRIIFLRIAEDRKVEEYGSLKTAVNNSDAYPNLFALFQQADTKYNSGLFDFKKDRISKELDIDNKTIKSIIDELYFPISPYEFSVLSVEILGNAYEQFLGKQITLDKNHKAKIEEKPEVRKAGGVYYTPQYIVEYVVEKTVGELVKGKTPKDITKLKIVDPACGSGSFLIGAYQFLLNWHQEYYKPDFLRLTQIATDSSEYNRKQREAAIKERQKLPLTPDGNLTTQLKKEIILNNIFGVDLDTNAVEVTKLSLLLKCMEGETQSSMTATISFGERVLPTLDNNIKSGNSLVDLDFYDSELDFGEERKIKPFSWEQAFPTVFKQGGFDVVLGNPPYVFGRDWKALGISDEMKQYLGTKFRSSSYQLDMFSIFIEQGFNLAKHNGGLVSYIVPNVWLNNTFSATTRTYVLRNSSTLTLTEPIERVFEGITVDTVIFISAKGKGAHKNKLHIEKISRSGNYHFLSSSFEKYYDGEEPISTSSTSEEIDLINKIRTSGNPLGNIAEITRGVHPYRLGGYGVSAFQNGPQIQRDLDDRPYHDKNAKPGFISFIYGKDLKRFTPVLPKEFIKYGKWLAEPRDPKFFTGDRIYSRKILGKRLVVTIEKEDSVADQQVYITIPKKDVSVEFLAAILGSSLMSFFIRRYFNESNDDFPQIKVGQLKSLPIKEIDHSSRNDKKRQTEIVNSVSRLLELSHSINGVRLHNKIEATKDQIAYLEQKIDSLIFDHYCLTDGEREIIVSCS